jgi:LEA14-like dessication related protein
MARRKRATKRRTTRRRMSGVGAMGSQVTGAIYTIAGAVAAGAVAKFLPATMNDKLKAAVPVVVGILLPKYLKGNIGAGVGAFLYYQYLQLMKYVIKVKGISVRRLGLKDINFDIFLNFRNESDVKIDIVEQKHKVYMNDIEISNILNYNTNIIQPNSTSVIGFNVSIDPTKILNIIKVDYMQMLTDPNKVNLSIDMNFKVRLYFFNVNINYGYQIGLKDLIELAKKPKQ